MAKKDLDALLNLGLIVLLLGIIALVVTMFMDTSVSTSSGDRVHNIGLMQRQQNFLVLSGLMIVVGGVLSIFSFVNSPKDAGTKKCPFCAELIKDDAIKCRFCGSSLHHPSRAIKPEELSAEELDKLIRKLESAEDKRN